MTGLLRGATLPAFLGALFAGSPRELDRAAMETPDYLLKRYPILHAAAEKFSARACHEVVAFWGASKESFAEELALYWAEIAEWLPVKVSDEQSIYAKFYRAQTMEYEEKRATDAYDLYLEISRDHPLAAHRCAILRENDRLKGWKLYTGKVNRAILSLQCLAIYLDVTRLETKGAALHLSVLHIL